MNKPELLAPAGDLEKLKVAFLYGADAVFLGLQNFGLRSNAGNFTLEEVEEGVKFAKQHNGKIYVTTNIFAHEENYENFLQTLKKLDKIEVTGIIVSDPGYIKIARENTNLEVHISTQQSILNSKAVDFYKRLGAKRVVLGRELSYSEIKTIAKKKSTELEIFIHGALCSSYSGRCTLSNHMTLRDSNRGGCCQSCRWNYELGYKEDDQFISYNFPTKFNMSSKDINLLTQIPMLINLNVDSFKIEGRMKSLHYVATVIKVYRAAIDSYFENPKNYEVKQEWIEELKKSESRKSSPGPFLGIKNSEGQIYGDQYQNKKFDYCGYVLASSEDGLTHVEQRNYFEIGDVLEVISPDEENFTYKLQKIYDMDGNELLKANHPQMHIKIHFDRKIKPNSIIRRKT